MKVLITGATGLIGSALIPFLQEKGHEVVRVIHQAKDKHNKDLVWDLTQPLQDTSVLEGYDAVIHLAGENIAAKRWTDKQKARILSSRLQSTQNLASALQALQQPPKVLMTASAIGYYGDCGEEHVTEAHGPGSLFLSRVCVEWEQAASEAEKRGIRTVQARFGVVLSPKGGALKTMIAPFKLGFGGVIGSGQQYISWITLDDVLGGILHVMEQPTLSGSVNFVSPKPITNREFTKILGRVLNRPTVLAMPAWLIRLLVGQMADELLLSSTYVIPQRLEQTGYPFKYVELENALKHLLT